MFQLKPPPDMPLSQASYPEVMACSCWLALDAKLCVSLTQCFLLFFFSPSLFFLQCFLIQSQFCPLFFCRLWFEQLCWDPGLLRPVQHTVWQPRLCCTRTAGQEEVWPQNRCLVHVSYQAYKSPSSPPPPGPPLSPLLFS
jgi:hypothetical protein